MEGHKIIKAMRIYLGMSQREVAEKLGMYLSVYQKYENIPGYVMQANFFRVCKILELMQLNPNKFFMERYELNKVGYEVASRGDYRIANEGPNKAAPGMLSGQIHTGCG